MHIPNVYVMKWNVLDQVCLQVSNTCVSPKRAVFVTMEAHKILSTRVGNALEGTYMICMEPCAARLTLFLFSLNAGNLPRAP